MKDFILLLCFVGYILLLRFLFTSGHPSIAVVIAILGFGIFMGAAGGFSDGGGSSCDCAGTPGCF